MSVNTCSCRSQAGARGCSLKKDFLSRCAGIKETQAADISTAQKLAKELNDDRAFDKV